MIHGLSSGIISYFRGGSFRAGFFSGLGSAFDVGTTGYGGMVGRTSIMAIIGGTFAKLGGGKFANGAMSAAFTHLFNAEVKKITNEIFRSSKWKKIGVVTQGAKALVVKAIHIRVELGVTGFGPDVYNANISKSFDYPSISDADDIVISFAGNQHTTNVYEIQLESKSMTNWHISIPRTHFDFISKTFTGMPRIRYAEVYAY